MTEKKTDTSQDAELVALLNAAQALTPEIAIVQSQAPARSAVWPWQVPQAPTLTLDRSGQPAPF